MADNPYDDHEGDLYVADPDQFDDDDGPPMPGWPKVVGILSIIWGSIGVICGALGGLWMGVLQPRFLAMAEQNMQGGFPPVLKQVDPMLVGQAAFGTLVAIYLIVCGSMLAARKPAARPMHLVYAVVAIVTVLVGIKFQLDMQSEIAQWVRENPSSDFAQTQGGAGGAVGRVAGLVFGITLGMAWPVFTLIWFGMVKRDSQAIAEGVEEQVA